MKKIIKISKWAAITILAIFIMMILRVLYMYQNIPAAVAKIHATKLTMDDVMGRNLPPDPGSSADATIAGVDANKNGIRDDVELAIFKEYPNSAKTRAVLLQYALTLQTEMTLPILNRETATAIVEDNENRAFECIWSISSRNDMLKFTKETDNNEKFVKTRQVNTEGRKKYVFDFYKYVGSYSMTSTPNNGCDLDISKLAN